MEPEECKRMARSLSDDEMAVISFLAYYPSHFSLIQSMFIDELESLIYKGIITAVGSYYYLTKAGMVMVYVMGFYNGMV
jgi:hypothetical protein